MFKDVLKNNNLSIAKCAEMSGIPQSTLADLAKGKTDIEKMSSGNLFKLSRCFGLSMEEMMFYCKLKEIDPECGFLFQESKKIEQMGIKNYVKLVQSTHLIETCHKLNDNIRLQVYLKYLVDYYKQRRLSVPKEYREYL